MMQIPSYLLPEPSCVPLDTCRLDEAQGCIRLTIASMQLPASCPLCQRPSRRVHSGYTRQVADLPWAGLPVQIELSVRRFFCDHPVCSRRIFTERLPTVVAPWARRTQRLASAQEQIGLALGGAAGERLALHLAMSAGVDLLLLLIRQAQTPKRPTPRVLGVDDWALRKGQTYGTILVDLEQGQVVDILPDRASETLARWLQEHPGVEIVSRDRAGAYAEGARVGAPDAIQVADRWHLLKNLTDAVYKALQPHHSAIEQMLRQQSGQEVGQMHPPVANSVLPASVATHQPTAADIARQQRAEEAHRLRQQGWTMKAIAHHLGLCTKTVRRHLNRSLPPTPLRRSGRARLIDAYRSYLLARWNAGCHNASQLWREIRAQGYAGQITMVREFISQLRRASGLPPRVRSLPGNPVKTDPSVRPPTVRALAYLIVRPPDHLDAAEYEHLAKLAAVHPKLQVVVELAREFAAMVRQRQAKQLKAWLEKATHSHVASLRSFAAGLRQDMAAVQAGLSLAWSNGPTEGHINRLKCLKRQMYGRAKLDLLRQRLLAA